MATDEEREAKRKRWEEREEERGERSLRIIKVDEQRAQILVEIGAADLEFAKRRASMMTHQEKYWRAMAAHPGEHDALFAKVLEEVQGIRKDLKNVVR